MTPKEYLKLRDEIRGIIRPLRDAINKAREAAELCEPPANRRRATEQDVVVGAVIWHQDRTGGWYWHEVEEVLHPSDDFKAYTADDGCRYGLHNAWVEMD